jgi:RNA polymerase sigma factor (sigma-70 family)
LLLLKTRGEWSYPVEKERAIDEGNWVIYVPIVKRYAAKFCRVTKLSYEELFQSGFVGLLEALGKLDVKTFEAPQQLRFIETHVWHHVLRAVRELQHPVYIPLYLNVKINRNEVSFSSVSDIDVDLESGLQDQKNSAKRATSNFTSVQDDKISRLHFRRILEEAISELKRDKEINENEAICFFLFHGLFDFPRHPLESISSILGIKTNTVSKKILKVMKLLKEQLPQIFSRGEVFNE